jgi:hypothetical protein
MPLTKEQKSFLFTQKIPFSEVFDATGFSKAEYQDRMREQNKLFAFGVTPCKKFGHALRSRAGHCIECDTSRIAYQRRHHIKGIVYIAGTHSKGLLKIGCTNDIGDRLQDLNMGGYGKAQDWEILLSAHGVQDAGLIESKAHFNLRDYNVFGTYIKQGKENECYELFKCSYKMARDILIGFLPANISIRTTNESRLLSVYNFE